MAKIPRTCDECNYTETQKIRQAPEQVICAFTEKPIYYYSEKHRHECPLPEWARRKEQYERNKTRLR